MRHFLLPSVAHLAQGVRPASPSTALVSAAGLALPRAASALCALTSAVARSLDVAQRAQDNPSSAIRRPADHDVQCDHGPPPGAEKLDFPGDLCDQECVEPRVSHGPVERRRARSANSGPSLFARQPSSSTPPARSPRVSATPSTRPSVRHLSRDPAAPRLRPRNRPVLYAAIASRAIAATGALFRDR